MIATLPNENHVNGGRPTWDGKIGLQQLTSTGASSLVPCLASCMNREEAPVLSTENGFTNCCVMTEETGLAKGALRETAHWHPDITMQGSFNPTRMKRGHLPGRSAQ